MDTTVKDSSLWAFLGPPVGNALAGGLAILPAARDLAHKSAIQLGREYVPVTFWQGVRGSKGLAWTMALVIPVQMGFEGWLADQMRTRWHVTEGFLPAFVRGGVVGFVTAALVTTANGKAAGMSVRNAFVSSFSLRIYGATTAQEACFVTGVRAAGPVAKEMKKVFGDHSWVDYTAAFISGAAGSLAGHWANTALTRWQNGMRMEAYRAFRGSLFKARAVGMFSVVFKVIGDAWTKFALPSK